MTTKDIIKILPLNEDLRLQILEQYDTMNPSQKFSIERLAWNSYDMIFQRRLDENLELQSAEIREGKAQIGEDFYKRAVKKTEEQIQSKIEMSSDKVDLTEARKAMEIIVREIQASKKKK